MFVNMRKSSRHSKNCTYNMQKFYLGTKNIPVSSVNKVLNMESEARVPNMKFKQVHLTVEAIFH